MVARGERLLSAQLDDLEHAWTDAVDRTVGEVRNWTVLYSGGLDSSLVAASFRDRAKVDLLTVGVPGSSDLRAAEEGARLLGLPWRGREVFDEDLRRIVGENAEGFAALSSPSRAVLVGLALGLDTARTRYVACGQGADELFLGYAHFEGTSDLEAERRRRGDLARLVEEDWPCSQQLAGRHARTLVSPFLEPRFFRHYSKLPIPELRSGLDRKHLLRQLARSVALPPELVGRPKRAFQYGSGIEKALRRLE